MKKSFVLILTLFFATLVFSSTSGKIKGMVVDENGDPLAGANIVIDGTTLGAESDGDGYYYIIGVRAGTYNVKCQYVGYSTKEAKKVKIRVGLSKKLNFKLLPQDIELDVVKFVETRDEKIEMDVTGSERDIDMGALEMSSVSDVEGMLSKQAGVKKDAAGDLHFRGGRAGEVSYVIDGISVGDPTGAKSNPVDVDFSNVESFNIQRGIPNAEYGNALSGSVNIVLKVGDQKKTSGHISYSTDSFMPKDQQFGLQQGALSISGPIPFTSSMKMRPTYYLATDLNMQDGYRLSYNKFGSDDKYDFGDYDVTGLGFEMPQKRTNTFNLIFKTSYDFSESMKLTTSLTKSRTHLYGYNYALKYTPEAATMNTTDITIFNVNFKHTIDQSSYYDLILSYFNRQYEQLPSGKTPDQFITNDQLDDFDKITYDVNNNGKRDGGNYEGFLDNNYILDESGQKQPRPNGMFDREYFIDANNNANYDIGEDFVDANGNGIWDGDILFDTNSNNQWDYWETGKSYNGFTAGTFTTVGGSDVTISGNNILQGVLVEAYKDNNLNGKFDTNIYMTSANDLAEPFTDGDVFNNTGEPFIEYPKFYFTSDSTIIRFNNGIWDDNDTETGVTREFPKSKTSTYPNFYAQLAEDANNGVSIDSTSTTIKLSYPKEEYLDLPSSDGSLQEEQNIPHENNMYNYPNKYPSNYPITYLRGKNMFDEYEAYTSFKATGVQSNPSDLGWQAGHSPSDNADYVEYIGSYITYKGPNPATLNKNATKMTHDAYSTWTDANNNNTFDIANGKFDSGEEYTDYNGNNTWNDLDRFTNPGYITAPNYSSQNNTVFKIKSSYTNQLNRNHMIKTGFEFAYNDLDYLFIQNIENPYNGTPDGGVYGNRGFARTYYKYKPLEFSYFLQDKMEFEDLVINLGARVDMRHHDDDAKAYYEKMKAADVPGYQENFEQTIIKISPRLGISHAISPTSKLFFTYGYLYQLPNYTRVYDPGIGSDANATSGNMNLSYEKNVQYELGINNQMGDYVLDVTGYFRDVYDQINTREFTSGLVKRTIFYNSDYGKTRGVEIQLDKEITNHYLWGLGYTIAYAYGKSSSATANAMAAEAGEAISTKEYPLNWDERHSLNAYATLSFAKGEKINDLPFTDNWSLSLSYDFGSGKPFTPTSEYYDNAVAAKDIETNSERIPWTSNTALKFSKTIAFDGENKKSYGKLKFDFNIYNLLNHKNILAVYSNTGTWNNPGNNNGENIITAHPERAASYANPYNVSEKRYYKFGVSYSW